MLALNILILTFVISAITLIKIIKSCKNKNDNNYNNDLIYKDTKGLICEENDIDDFVQIYVMYCTEYAPNFILEDRNGNTIINFKGDYIDSNQNDIKNPKNQVDFTFYSLSYDESLIYKYLIFRLYLKYNDYRYTIESKGYEDENFEAKVEYEIDYAEKEYVREMNKIKRGIYNV